MKAKLHKPAIVAAGFFWGIIGCFVRRLSAMGMSSEGMVVIRCGIAALMFAVLILVTDPSLFKIKLRDAWCFLGSGILSMLFFTFCYYRTISLTSMSTAAILLYTSPAFVMLMSLLFFKEKLTGKKLIALVAVIIGCALSSGIGGKSPITPMGIVFGICSGFGYALYSIFAEFAMQRGYDSRTISFYSVFIATVGACILWGAGEPVQIMISSPSNLLWCVATGGITCFLPYLFYTYGLSGVEAGTASIMVAVEPAVATVAGIVFFGEALTITGCAGVGLVIAAIALLNK